MARKQLRRQPISTVTRPTQHAPFFIGVIANAIAYSGAHIYLRDFGVGTNDWRVLSYLGHSPGATAQDISNVLGVNKSVVSRSVKLLVGLELIGIDASSGQRLLFLTRAGVRLHDRLLPVALERERLLLGDLDEAEVEQLLALLRRLHDHLPAMVEYDPLAP